MKINQLVFAIAAILGLQGCTSRGLDTPDLSAALEHPNIVLIVFEDMSPRIGAFGDDVASTPYLDALAEQSVRYPNTFTTAGVCAPSRSSLITGVHQQRLGTHQMRTNSPVPGMSGGGPIEYEAVPPAEVKAFPELLRRAGYYTTNNGKTDYQFGEPFTIWDANGPDADWRGRADGQPFFAMFNILETHESYIWPEDRESVNPLVEIVTQRNRRDLAGKERLTDPADVEVPPYLPDTPLVRRDIATHYDNIAFAEKRVADIIARLDADGLLDNTIVIVTSDHGDGLPRMKRTVYDAGIKVPLMVRYPDGRRAGEVDTRLVSFVDLAPTIIAWAGVEVPRFVQGRNFVTGEQRGYIFAAADRHDSAPGRTKAARDARFKYIRSYQPDLAVLRPLAFRDALPTMQEVWRLAEEKALRPPALRLVSSPRGAEELYDTEADPHEIANLVGDPAHRATLVRLRAAMDGWIARTGDLSAIPEADMIEAMWPGMVQPVTAAPVIALESGRVRLSSDTPGASITFTLDGGDPASGNLYVGPFMVDPGTQVSAKAIRYGYAPSETAVASVP
ncbi:sulfatase-like hydrolase/transferase [Qipengyuania sp.]|uniref:sulfatase-like hydrolase/transferase n=1 Tax=Qipengyuania sp. TaxID=2004515 RepID=UPI003BABD2F2